jgi:hypothetical protein
VRVEALLGEGGFASVYRVQDVTTQKVSSMPAFIGLPDTLWTCSLAPKTNEITESLFTSPCRCWP